jgi:hypothetical protein
MGGLSLQMIVDRIGNVYSSSTDADVGQQSKKNDEFSIECCNFHLNLSYLCNA